MSTGCPLPGEVNVANALAALAACADAGLDVEAVAAGIAASGGVPGRFERIEEGQDFTVVVDYAHKPDAVDAALRTLRPLTDGELIVVLGAGGDRDPGKRQIMGGIAAGLADVLVVTDDNPRSEDPAPIRRAMLLGAQRVRGKRVLEIGDRREAIAEAIRLARPGDIVLIAGKGHETGQEVAGTVHPFDDREVARAVSPRQGVNGRPGGVRNHGRRQVVEGPDRRGDHAMRAVLLGGGISLLISLLGTRFAIRQFTRLGYGQEIRDDGPTTHHTKRGTPTMGGVVIVLASVVGYFAAKLITWTAPSASALLLIFLFVGLGFVGFLDDFIKVAKQRSLGLREQGQARRPGAGGAVFGALALSPVARGRQRTDARPRSRSRSSARSSGWVCRWCWRSC